MRYAEQLFPADHGAVYMFNESGKFMEAVCMWGKEPIEHSFTPEDCWGLRGGHLYTAEAPENLNVLCRHIRARGISRNQMNTMCVPMMAQGETIGMFHIRSEQKAGDTANINAKRKFAKEQLVVAVTEHITLALSNLKLQDTLRQQSIHDSLTGLFNRRYMKDSLEREMYRAKRHNSPFGLIMLDIDFFKKFNDEYGHDVGDMVLEKVGRMVKMTIRPEDIPCRYGGEEFLIILPGAGQEGTNMCASRLIEETRKLKVKSKGSLMSGVTVSMGIASFPLNGDAIESVVKAADNALLAAKNSGRDCVVISSEKAEQPAALQ
jgi:diguanylate cyclase (GGDEF)-like protein